MGSNMADTVISAIHVYSGIHVYYFVLNTPLNMTIQAYMFIWNRRVDTTVISMIDWPKAQSYVYLFPMLQTNQLFRAIKSS